MSELIPFDSLLGEHLLTGVDMSNTHVETYEGSDCFEYANQITFALDGITYTATEDPSDGYRSCLKSLIKSDAKIQNTFPPVKVVASMKPSVGEYRDAADEILILTVNHSGKVVLEVGTDHQDSYYPMFVGRYDPEALQ